MELFTDHTTREMEPTLPEQTDQDLADLHPNSLPLNREAAPGDRVPVNPIHFYVTKPYEPRIRDVPSLEAHTVKDLTNYENVDGVLYGKNLLMGPVDCLSG